MPNKARETAAAKRARTQFIEQEDELLEKRRASNAKAIRAVVTDGGATEANCEPGHGGRVPRVAVLLSGGGWRAMSSGAAFLDGLAATGLLDCVESVMGVSGGSWCAAQIAFSDPDFNPFHLTRGANPWCYGNRPDPTKHDFDGIVKMVDVDHVRTSCGMDHEARWRDFLIPRNWGWGCLRQGYLTLARTSDDTLFHVGLRSKGAMAGDPPLTCWADFVGRGVLGAWNPTPCDTVDFHSSYRDAVKSGALPNVVLSCISTDVPNYDVATESAPQSDPAVPTLRQRYWGPPDNVWCEFTVGGMRSYAEQQVYALSRLKHVPITEDNYAFAPLFDIRGVDRMAMCGSAFAYDFKSNVAASELSWIFSPLTRGQVGTVSDGLGKYLNGSKTAVGVAGHQIGRIRDAGLDFNVPYPAVLSPENVALAELSEKTWCRNLVFASGRKFDVLLVHDASEGITGAKSLSECVSGGYYRLHVLQQPGYAVDNISEPKNGDREHDLDQIGRFRVFFPVAGTSLPIIVFMLGVCCEPTGRVIYDRTTIREYVYAVRERTACMEERGQTNNRCLVGAAHRPGYYATVRDLLRRLLDKPAWRGDGLSTSPLPPAPPRRKEDEPGRSSTLLEAAHKLRMELSDSSASSIGRGEYDSQFARMVLHRAFDHIGVRVRGRDEDRAENGAAFRRLANAVHQHASTAEPLTHGRHGVVLSREGSRRAPNHGWRCNVRRTDDGGIYDFALSYAILRADILREGNASAKDPTEIASELHALDSVYRPTDHVLDFVEGPPRFELGKPASLVDPTATTTTENNGVLLLAQFPRAARYAADSTAGLYFYREKVHRRSFAKPESSRDPSATTRELLVVQVLLRSHADVLRSAVLRTAALHGTGLATYHKRQAAARSAGVQDAIECVTAFQQRWSQLYFDKSQGASQVDASSAVETAGVDVTIPSDLGQCRWLGGLAAVMATTMQPMTEAITNGEASADAVLMMFEAVMRSGNVELFDNLRRSIGGGDHFDLEKQPGIAVSRSWLAAKVELGDLVRSGNYDAVERFIMRRRGELEQQTKRKGAQTMDKSDQTFVESLAAHLEAAMDLDGPQMAIVLLDPISSTADVYEHIAQRRERFANKAVAAGRWRNEAWAEFLATAATEIVVDDAATAPASLDFARRTFTLRRLTVGVVCGDEVDEFDALLSMAVTMHGGSYTAVSKSLGFTGQRPHQDIDDVRGGRATTIRLREACALLRRDLCAHFDVSPEQLWHMNSSDERRSVREFDALIAAALKNGLPFSYIFTELRELAPKGINQARSESPRESCDLLRRALSARFHVPPERLTDMRSRVARIDTESCTKELCDLTRRILFRGPVAQLCDIDLGGTLARGDEGITPLVLEWLRSPHSNKVAKLRTQAIVHDALREELLNSMTTSQTLIESAISVTDGKLAASERETSGRLGPQEKWRRGIAHSTLVS